ncbi:MAG: deoxyribodipyrimidine photo-lyase [Cryobacterium sp.]|nr:deoxyribodipyrimidine photo-lyase [Oligoflexia bacterium]
MSESQVALLCDNDFRATDNPALSAAVNSGEKFSVVGFETPSLSRASTRRRTVYETARDSFFRALEKNRIETKLMGHSQSLIRELKELGFRKVLVNSSVGTEENATLELVRQNGLQVEVFAAGDLFEESDLPFRVTETPSTFTHFRKLVERSAISVRKGVTDLGEEWVGEDERAARDRFKDYTFDQRHIDHYLETRNGLLSETDSSRLSIDLARGVLSVRWVWHEILRYETEVAENKSTYWLRFELLWREYFRWCARQAGANFFLNVQKSIFFEPSLGKIQKWKEGRTESRFVNACMNELRATGFLSNRGRQNAASYFAKTLKQDWRIGAAYFESELIDYDVSSNWGNWNYLAGTGNDPRDRIFNPEVQAEIYDPSGEYRRKWADSE